MVSKLDHSHIFSWKNDDILDTTSYSNELITESQRQSSFFTHISFMIYPFLSDTVIIVKPVLKAISEERAPYK